LNEGRGRRWRATKKSRAARNSYAPSGKDAQKRLATMIALPEVPVDRGKEKKWNRASTGLNGGPQKKKRAKLPIKDKAPVSKCGGPADEQFRKKENNDQDDDCALLTSFKILGLGRGMDSKELCKTKGPDQEDLRQKVHPD